jgi:Leucine-rich repeat (LRR) protein
VTPLSLCCPIHAACLRIKLEREEEFEHEASEAERNDSLTPLPSSLITLLSLITRIMSHKRVLPADVYTRTAFSVLEFKAIADDDVDKDGRARDSLRFSIAADHLGRQTGLRLLWITDQVMSGTAEKLLSLPALAGLEYLELTGCSLQDMPRALSTLSQLTALYLTDNNITTTAPLATLQRLQSLQLGICNLTAVPEQLSTLTALTFLDLSSNSLLAGGWQHLMSLNQLHYLNLGTCSFTAVPEQLSALTALSHLELYGNRGLAGDLQHLQRLQLQALNLSGCGLTAVAEQLSALTALTHLDLSHNMLIGGWHHLLRFTRLQSLNLSGCGLTAVAKQLSALTALNRLDLSINNLESGWQHLQLPRLRTLHLTPSWLPGGQVPPLLANLQVIEETESQAIFETILQAYAQAPTQAEEDLV